MSATLSPLDALGGAEVNETPNRPAGGCWHDPEGAPRQQALLNGSRDIFCARRYAGLRGQDEVVS